jgi:hypothetical protein
VERGTAYRLKTLRLHPHEDRAINEACSALLGIERAALMSEASMFEATRLGIRFSAEPPPPLTTAWPYLPERGEEPTGVRVSITISLSVLELIQRAADYVHASEPLFIIGSTLAYIGRLQSQLKGLHADTPAEAEELQRKLKAIELPSQYQYRRRPRR